eukprot:1342054-Amorphochlora_amoeboformis.AAC.1
MSHRHMSRSRVTRMSRTRVKLACHVHVSYRFRTLVERTSTFTRKADGSTIIDTVDRELSRQEVSRLRR